MHVPSMRHERILPRNALPRNNRLPPRRQTPPTRPKRAVQDPPILYLRQVQDAIGLAFDVFGRDGREEHVGGFFGEGFGAEAVEGARPVYLAGAFVEDEGLVGEAGCQVGDGGLVVY